MYEVNGEHFEHVSALKNVTNRALCARHMTSSKLCKEYFCTIKWVYIVRDARAHTHTLYAYICVCVFVRACVRACVCKFNS